MFEIGNSLRESRLRRSIEIAQAEQATKIRAKYLRALEEERFEQLPSQTYVKGFLRTYADYLGLDGQLYVDEFNSRFVAGDDRDSRPRRSAVRPERRNRRIERNIVLLALTVVAIVTVVVISAWERSSGNPTTTPPPVHRVRKHKPAKPVPSKFGLEIRAVKGNSYVEVHKTGPTGRLLFQGTVDKRHPQTFTGHDFWLSLSSPENLAITAAGKSVSLSGLKPVTLTVTRAGARRD